MQRQATRHHAAHKSLAPGLALATLGAIAFSGKAIIVKLAYRHGVDAVTLIMLRMLFALPLFAVMAWWAGRGKPALTRRDWLGVVGLGFSGYYLSSFLDFAGLAYITAEPGAADPLSQPDAGAAVRLDRLPAAHHALAVRRHERSAMPACCWCSAMKCSLGQSAAAAWGALLVFLSAVSYAVYLVASGEFVKRLGSLRLVGLATSVACVLCIAQFLLLRPMSAAFEVAPQVIWLSILNATLCTALPVLAVMMAIERIGPAMAAQTGMVGPMSTILMGVVILGEPFTAWIAAGTVLVITGIFVFTRMGR